MNANGQSSDEKAIHALYQKMLDSWTTGDGYAYADQFTDDAMYIVATGVNEIGREEIASGHQQIFDTWAKNTRLIGQIEHLRFLSPEIVYLVATGSLLMQGQTTADEKTIYSLIAKKFEGHWQFVAYQNTPIQNAISMA